MRFLNKICLLVLFVVLSGALASLVYAEESADAAGGGGSSVADCQKDGGTLQPINTTSPKAGDLFLKCNTVNTKSISYCEYVSQINPEFARKFICTDFLEGILRTDNVLLKSIKDTDFDDSKIYCIRNTNDFENPTDDTISGCKTIVSGGGFKVFEYYVGYFYKLALNVGSILAVLILIVSGILYTVSGVSEGTKKIAGDLIFSTLSGLALLLFIGILLRVVNPTFFT